MAQPSVTTTLVTNQGVQTFTSVNAANLNQFWGDIASDLGNAGIMGQHSSSHGTFTPNPGDGGRQGVGNLSKNDPRFDNTGLDSHTNLADGGQGLHATFQAARLGDPNLPPGAVEATVGPFFPEGHGNVEVLGITPLDDHTFF
jgi:hypothetical protein